VSTPAAAIRVATDAILAAVLPSYGMDTDPAEVPSLRRNAATGLAHALRVLARASTPGERFSLNAWADQLAQEATKPRKARR
jgi:hypothetical protein